MRPSASMARGDLRSDDRSPLRLLVLLCLLALACAPALAHTPSPAGKAPTSAFPTQNVWTSEAHGYRLHLPAGWRLAPPSGPNDLADVRFAGPVDLGGPAYAELSGVYHVFEAAIGTDPKTWYDTARTRYESASRSMPRVKKVHFGPLHTARLGGQPAHAYEFDIAMFDGETLTTHVIFVTRRVGKRVDMHEMTVVGNRDVMKAGKPAVQRLERDLEWLQH